MHQKFGLSAKNAHTCRRVAPNFEPRSSRSSPAFLVTSAWSGTAKDSRLKAAVVTRYVACNWPRLDASRACGPPAMLRLSEVAQACVLSWSNELRCLRVLCMLLAILSCTRKYDGSPIVCVVWLLLGENRGALMKKLYIIYAIHNLRSSSEDLVMNTPSLAEPPFYFSLRAVTLHPCCLLVALFPAQSQPPQRGPAHANE